MADYEIGTLKELSNYYAKKQPHQVENILEETSVLDTVKFEPASHALWNVYDEVTDITGGGFVDMDAPLEIMDVASKLKKVDLSIMGGEMFCPEDKAQAFGGKAAYFAKKTPKALRKLGVDTEIALIYDNLRAYALDQENAIDVGGENNTNYCILAVRWVPGETVGLYSPTGFAQGAMINTKALNDGALYKDPDSKVNGYGVRLKGYFGFQFANPKTVAGLFNIDPANDKLPTEAQVDDMLAMVRANPKNTFIYGHYKMASILGRISKASKTQYSPSDQEVNTLIAKWNGVPIVSSYNFKQGNEANVTIS